MPIADRGNTPRRLPARAADRLVDPADRTPEVFKLREGQWVLIATAKDDDPVSVPPFEAITFGLDALWP